MLPLYDSKSVLLSIRSLVHELVALYCIVAVMLIKVGTEAKKEYLVDTPVAVAPNPVDVRKCLYSCVSGLRI